MLEDCSLSDLTEGQSPARICGYHSIGQRTGVALVTMTATKATRAENLEKSGNGTRQSIRQVRSGFVIHEVYLIGRADNTGAILVHVADLGG
jgi:hypothetical protein